MPHNNKNKSGAETKLLPSKWLGGQSRDYSQRDTASKERTIDKEAQEQLDSLSTQESCYENKIKANPNWQFAGIYSDVGSGTTV